MFGSAIMEKWLVHFVQFRRKSDPLSSNIMMIQIMLSEALPDPQTLIDWVGKKNGKTNTPLFYLTMPYPYPISVVSREAGGI